MTRKENIFFAKKLFTELVFSTAYIEHVNVSFPQTQAIIDGAVVNGISVSDIQTVLNLKDAWKYMLEHIDTPLSVDYICKINELVSRNESLEWGTFRTGKIGISGTDYVPPIPTSDTVKNFLQSLDMFCDAKTKATEYFCYAVRNQLFWDGNKRTSTIVANKILIEQGQGVLSIGEKDALRFNEALQYFYNTADKRNLTECLLKCIKGNSKDFF